MTRDRSGPPGLTTAVGRFMLASLAAIAVVVVGGFFALREVAIDEAERDTRERVQAEGRLVEAAGLEDGILRGDRGAIARLDDLVQGRVVSGSLVRVKLWTRDGRILYSDEPTLIGRRFGLDEEEVELFDTGGADAELSDLGDPENRFERPQGKLLEAHTPIRTPDGTPVLFEIYQRFDAVNASGERLLKALAPPLAGGLLVLVVFQLPLAWTFARRLQRGHREREALLARAVESSERERSRIAADLHDGVVQDLAGIAFGLAPAAAAARRRGDEDEAAVLDVAIDHLRQGVRDLRTLLVEIHPPNLASAGMQVALSDLLSPLGAAGIATTLEVDDGPPSPHDPLVYRAAREALSNVRRHAAAAHVEVRLEHPAAGRSRLRVRDDGAGFAAAERARRAEEGHLGLTLLDELAGQAGGRLEVASVPGEGTTVTLEVPA